MQTAPGVSPYHSLLNYLWQVAESLGWQIRMAPLLEEVDQPVYLLLQKKSYFVVCDLSPIGAYRRWRHLRQILAHGYDCLVVLTTTADQVSVRQRAARLQLPPDSRVKVQFWPLPQFADFLTAHETKLAAWEAGGELISGWRVRYRRVPTPPREQRYARQRITAVVTRNWLRKKHKPSPGPT